LLSRVGQLGLITAIADQVLVPEAVMREIDAGSDRDRAAERVRAMTAITIVADVVVTTEVAARDLGAGESQVLARAHTTADSEAVIDDRAARRCAASIGVPMLGTLAIVVLGRRRGLIPALRPVLDDLEANGMRLSPVLRADALATVDEFDDA
jgi:predicted nucleic acid-binding protein